MNDSMSGCLCIINITLYISTYGFWFNFQSNVQPVKSFECKILDKEVLSLFQVKHIGNGGLILKFPNTSILEISLQIRGPSFSLQNNRNASGFINIGLFLICFFNPFPIVWFLGYIFILHMMYT